MFIEFSGELVNLDKIESINFRIENYKCYLHFKDRVRKEEFNNEKELKERFEELKKMILPSKSKKDIKLIEFANTLIPYQDLMYYKLDRENKIISQHLKDNLLVNIEAFEDEDSLQERWNQLKD